MATRRLPARRGAGAAPKRKRPRRRASQGRRPSSPDASRRADACTRGARKRHARRVVCAKGMREGLCE
eukprot:5179231-Pleurochrysis_carterae.AAC.1